MDATKDGGPAFPVTTVTRYGDEHQLPGMSLRDWFAGLAMQGAIASTAHPNAHGPSEFTPQQLATAAYEAADAMLAERERVSP